MPSGGSSKQTVGYKYYLGCHMGLCHGPIDAITEIQVDKRVAWTGLVTEGTITVSAPNAYLQSQLGSDIPAFRGVASLVFNQTYMGNNPYLKPWKFKAVRIDATSSGEEQWYLAKAAIGEPRLSYDCADLNSYFVGEFIETAWSSYPIFADYFPDPYSGYELRTTSGSILTAKQKSLLFPRFCVIFHSRRLILTATAFLFLR